MHSQSSPFHRYSHWLFLIVLALFLYRVSQFFFIGDDAFISFRYAQNLANGEGPVWNPGYRVEGYTNFLWVLIGAAAIYLGIPIIPFTHALTIISGAIVLLLIYNLGKRLYPKESSILWPLATPALLAMHPSFAAWSSGGLETMPFTLLVTLALLSFINALQEKNSFLLTSFLFAAAALLRPEGGLFWAICFLLLIISGLRGRTRFCHLITLALPFAVIVGSHFVWRYSYYGFLLPNTFYAKVSGIWLDQAKNYFGLYLSTSYIHYFLPLLILLIFISKLAWKEVEKSYLSDTVQSFLIILLGYLSYVAAVGGDRFEFRFLVVIFPLFYFLLTFSIYLLSRYNLATRVVSYLTLLALIATSTSVSIDDLTKKQRHGVAPISGIRSYANNRIQQGKFLRTYIDSGALPKDLLLGVGGAGALPYYTGWPTVDKRGLNDIYVARLPIKKRGIIAHEKKAPLNYLREREVEALDLYNRMVFNDDRGASKGQKAKYDRNNQLSVYAKKLGDKYFVFGSFVSKEQRDKRLGKLISGKGH